MSINKTITITEARKNIFKIAEEVQIPAKRFYITEKGRPKAVIMSAVEFESWAETLEVMSDFPNLKKDIVKAKKEYKGGDYKTLDDYEI